MSALTATQLRSRVLKHRMGPCKNEVEYRDRSTGELLGRGPCRCPVFNSTPDGRLFCADCESGSINGLATDDKRVRRAVPLRVIVVPGDGPGGDAGMLVEMRLWIEQCEADQEQVRLDRIRARNVAIIKALRERKEW